MVAPVRVGVIGAGQLARMMIPAAIELGVELRVLAEGDGMAAALAAERRRGSRTTARSFHGCAMPCAQPSAIVSLLPPPFPLHHP